MARVEILRTMQVLYSTVGRELNIMISSIILVVCVSSTYLTQSVSTRLRLLYGTNNNDTFFIDEASVLRRKIFSHQIVLILLVIQIGRQHNLA